MRKSTLLLFAYLGHLLLPGLLLLDVLTAWQHGRVHFEWWGANTYIGLFSAIWLAMGLGVFLLSCDREGFLRKISNPLVSIWVIYAMLVLMEVFARTTLRLAPPIPGQLPPGRTRLGPINPAVFPGIHGVKTFTINALGFRGPMPPPRKLAYRILAVGGSTTICTYLDDSEEWPHVLMEKMNAAPESLRVWVGNAGVSGRTTVYHLVFLQWLPGVIDVDMVIFLVGINDFLADLAFEGASNQKLLEKTAGYEGDLAPGTRWRSLRPYYQRLQLYQVIARATGDLRQRFGARQGEDSTEQLPTAARASDIDVPWFRQRRASMPPAPMPDLSTGLEEYRHRLLSLASLCGNLKLRCLFLTQPSIYRPDLSPTELRLLWEGPIGRWEHPKGYASVADLERGMDAYNHMLLEVCRQNGLECYDLASHIPKDTSAFYDDVHFNEAGARLVAETLKEYLLAGPPFGMQPSSSGALPVATERGERR